MQGVEVELHIVIERKKKRTVNLGNAVIKNVHEILIFSLNIHFFEMLLSFLFYYLMRPPELSVPVPKEYIRAGTYLHTDLCHCNIPSPSEALNEEPDPNESTYVPIRQSVISANSGAYFSDRLHDYG